MNIKMYIKNLFKKLFISENPFYPFKAAIAIFCIILLVDYCIMGSLNVVVFFMSAMTLATMFPICLYNERLLQEKQLREIQAQKEHLELEKSIKYCMEMNNVIREENSIKSPDTESKCSTAQAQIASREESGRFPAPKGRWPTVYRDSDL
jgi:hypothetical protein